jgi:hypothetical protein
MAYNLSAFAGAGAQFFNDSGVPLTGGLLYSYTAGTTTPATTWTTNAGTVANTNPIVLDSAGRTPNEIWIAGGVDYKFILKTSTGVTVGTYDNIPSLNDFTAFNNLTTVTGTNSLIGTSVPPFTAYTTGMTISFIPVATNTGAVTLDLDGLGAKNVYFDASTPLNAGAIAVGKIATLEYDGTRFQMTNSFVTGQIPDGAITTAKLADNAVTTIKITDLNVTTGKLADNAVTTIKITDANVTTAKIANANVTPAKLSQPFTAGTAVASTSGTEVGFTSIPSWVRRITMMLSGVSTNGNSLLQAQLGSTTYTTSGYNTTYSAITASSGSGAAAGTSGVLLNTSTSVLTTIYGTFVFTLLTGNTWTYTFMGYDSNGTRSMMSSGAIALGGTLDRIRLTTVNGTDTFDAGSVNILYE